MTTAEGWTKYASVALLLVVVCLPSPTSPTPIGIVDLPPPDASSSQNRTTGVGIIIGRRGYGTEAMRWTLGMAFRRYGFHRVGLAVAEGNAGARRVYEKAGFVYEGVKRKNTWLEGQWWDTIIMGILETEWLAN
ncbi:hypothetical protein PLICRDRAFT_141988 [Plicaturopsis crispa FD-325 SS-3]|nr:hypothetical protein PLICRDRAFT_141988 [Plicaturopsis crispa FD-325 SS-3]